MAKQNDNEESFQVIEYLKNLEQRITIIEDKLHLSKTENETDENLSYRDEENTEPNSMEIKFGEYWFTNFAIIVLAIGVISILTLPFQEFHPILPSTFGMVCVGALIGMSFYWKKSYPYLSTYLIGAGLGLSYFSALRLFHFSPETALSGIVLEVIILTSISTLCLITSTKLKVKYLIALSLTMFCLTGIISNNPLFLFILLSIIASTFVFYRLKYELDGLIIYGLSICYLSHFIWAINNPFMGNEMMLVSEPGFNLIFLIVYAVIFSFGNFLHKPKAMETELSITGSILNALGCYALFLVISFSKFVNSLPEYHTLLAIAFLALAIASWKINMSMYSTFIYSLLAYASMSIAIIGSASVPEVYIYLIWQSLLVIATAIWFRSKYIVISNFIIYMAIFVTYLIASNEFSLISLSFGLIAIISARVLNWKKHRLTIKTELMRNVYLTIAFISVPYTLLKSVPPNFVVFSLLAVIILYYAMSILLKNSKYRWMAHLTTIGSIGYTLLYGTSNMDSSYLIYSLLALGMILLAVSLTYHKLHLRKDEIEKSKPKHIKPIAH